MKVKDILELSARLLDKPDTANYIKTGTATDATTAQKEKAELLVAYNLIASELSQEYFPLVSTEFFSEGGKIYFTELEHSIIDLIDVFDHLFNPVQFTKSNTYVSTDERNVYIRYTYLPVARLATDDSDFDSATVGERVIAYGIASEYCLIKGRYDDAEAWQQRYQASIAKMLSPRNKKRIKARRWY